MNCYFLLLCAESEKVFIIPALWLYTLLKNTGINLNDSWVISIYEYYDSSDFDLQINHVGKFQINDYLNAYELLKEIE